jgi:hypothetical protein
MTADTTTPPEVFEALYPPCPLCHEPVDYCTGHGDIAQQLADARQTIEQQRADWEKLNHFLNRTAESYGWCGEFEERLDSYNEAFVTLKLTHRERSGRGNRQDPYGLCRACGASRLET